jgi:hypothetical protein
VAAAAAAVVAGHLVEVATAEAVEGAVQVQDLVVVGLRVLDTADEGDTMVTVIRHSTAHRQACTVAAGVLLAVAAGISTVTVTVTATATATVTAIGTAIGTATGGVVAVAAAAVSTRDTAAVAAVIGGDTLTGA